jgi:pilus assembly protein CpaB
MDQATTRRNVLALAVVLALLAGVLMWVFLRGQTHTDGTKVSAIYATESIPASTVIEPGMVVEKAVDRSQVPEGVSTSQDSVVGRVAMSSFASGDRIQSGQVQEKSAALGLAFVVDPGMRAVTVALDPIIGVAGFLKPGNRVDVVATFNVNDGTITKTVLQNQLLLAAGSQIINTGSASGRQTQENAPNATLSVDPADAEKLILAESKGKLRLTLRAQGDIVRAPTRGITSRALIGYVPPDAGSGQQSSELPTPPARAVYQNPRWNRPSDLIYGQMPLPAVTHAVRSEPSMEIEVIKGSQVERVPVKT